MDERKTLSSPERIHNRREFLRVYKEGDKLHSRSFVLYLLPREDGNSRLGLTVSRRIGGSVVRSRVKRLLREIFRLRKRDLTCNCDVVINARRTAATACYQDLDREYVQAIKRWKKYKQD